MTRRIRSLLARIQDCTCSAGAPCGHRSTSSAGPSMYSHSTLPPCSSSLLSTLDPTSHARSALQLALRHTVRPAVPPPNHVLPPVAAGRGARGRRDGGFTGGAWAPRRVDAPAPPRRGQWTCSRTSGSATRTARATFPHATLPRGPSRPVPYPLARSRAPAALSFTVCRTPRRAIVRHDSPMCPTPTRTGHLRPPHSESPSVRIAGWSVMTLFSFCFVQEGYHNPHVPDCLDTAIPAHILKRTHPLFRERRTETEAHPTRKRITAGPARLRPNKHPTKKKRQNRMSTQANARHAQPHSGVESPPHRYPSRRAFLCVPPTYAAPEWGTRRQRQHAG